ncbi:MAG TPA: NAD-dependent epimerase/dehydratase family protein, partial [Rhodanobacteraceae bacterium]|nr:NAD-dependent epimerase/dehydratase family protein [Rhodanobacteraceae bacterium]
MDVLVIGGNRFIGRSFVLALRFRRHRITVLNRGTLTTPPGVEHVVADRTTDAFDAALAGRRFDAVVDFAAFDGADARRALRVVNAGHYIVISTGQVYLVREGATAPFREADYAGPVMAAPPTPVEHDDWAYGIGKREVEDAFAAAPFLTTRLRIPMVSGEGDPKRRYEKYLRAILAGGPVVVPRADQIARHVYRGSLVDALIRLVEQPPAASNAFNFCQREEPTVRELIELIASAARAPRPEIVDGETTESPFSSRWMSCLDP